MILSKTAFQAVQRKNPGRKEIILLSQRRICFVSEGKEARLCERF